MNGERVYMEHGRTTHYLRPGTGGPNGTASETLCGRSSWPAMWRGTGNAEERETAAEMPLCSPCDVAYQRERDRQARKRAAQDVGWRGTNQGQQSQTRGNA